MNGADPAKTRQYYRIRYPVFYQPKVRIIGENNDYEVVELSERGVRFIYKGRGRLSTGSEIKIKITFYDGETFQFSGDLLRAEKKDVIMRFKGRIPLSRIMKEQHYLIEHTIGNK